MNIDPNKPWIQQKEYRTELYELIKSKKSKNYPGSPDDYLELVDKRIGSLCKNILQRCIEEGQESKNYFNLKLPTYFNITESSYKDMDELLFKLFYYNNKEVLGFIATIFERIYGIQLELSVSESNKGRYLCAYASWSPKNKFIYSHEEPKYVFAPEKKLFNLYQAALKSQGTDLSYTVKFKDEKDVVFHAHKFMLISNSEWWTKALGSGLDCTVFEDFPAKIHQLYLEFIYTGDIKNDYKEDFITGDIKRAYDEEDIIGLAKLAEQNVETGLSDFCYDILKGRIDDLNLEDFDSFNHAFKLGRYLSLDEFVIKCLKFADVNQVGADHLKAIMSSEDWNDQTDLFPIIGFAEKMDLSNVKMACLEQGFKALRKLDPSKK